MDGRLVSSQGSVHSLLGTASRESLTTGKHFREWFIGNSYTQFSLLNVQNKYSNFNLLRLSQSATRPCIGKPGLDLHAYTPVTQSKDKSGIVRTLIWHFSTILHRPPNNYIFEYTPIYFDVQCFRDYTSVVQDTVSRKIDIFGLSQNRINALLLG